MSSSSPSIQDLKNENERLQAELKQMLENYSIISKKCDSLQKDLTSIVALPRRRLGVLHATYRDDSDAHLPRTR